MAPRIGRLSQLAAMRKHPQNSPNLPRSWAIIRLNPEKSAEGLKTKVPGSIQRGTNRTGTYFSF